MYIIKNAFRCIGRSNFSGGGFSGGSFDWDQFADLMGKENA